MHELKDTPNHHQMYFTKINMPYKSSLMTFFRPIFGVVSGCHARWFTTSPPEERVWPQSSSHEMSNNNIWAKKWKVGIDLKKWHWYPRFFSISIIMISCTNNILYKHKHLYGEKENKWHEIFSFCVLSATFHDPHLGWVGQVSDLTDP